MISNPYHIPMKFHKLHFADENIKLKEQLKGLAKAYNG